MRILKTTLSLSLVLGLLVSAVNVENAFAQRGGGRGGGGGGRGGWSGGGGGRSFNGGGGGRSFQGGRSFSGGQPRSFSGGQPRNPGNGSNRNFDSGRSSRSFSDRNFGDRNFSDAQRRQSNYRGDLNRGDFNRNDRDRNQSFGRNDFRNYRGNFNRNNSTFFGNNGLFGNNYGRGLNNFNYGNYGQGFGYGGYRGYGGYGLGYGRYGNYGYLPFLGMLGLGGLGGWGYSPYGLGYAGYGLGYGGFGPGYGGYYAGGYSSHSYAQTVPQTTTADASQPAPPPGETGQKSDFVAIGEAEFRAGNYQSAISAFRHALVDEPNNAGLMLMISQALFQTGQWTQAAGATELAMGGLPEDKWGAVVQNYRELYGNIEDYTRQLKELENAVKQDPNNPALRFLVGYHFGYLGYPKQAVRELGKSVELEGRDPAARRLHDIFAAKIGAPEVGPVKQQSETEKTSQSSSTVPTQTGAPTQTGTES